MPGSGTYVSNTENHVVESSPWDLVSGRFDITQAYADGSYSITYDYIRDMQSLLSELTLPSTDSIGNITAPEITPINYVNRPSVSKLDTGTDIPEFENQKPNLEPAPGISDFNLPVIGFSEPQWSALSKPVLREIETPGEQPPQDSIEVPAAPQITLPDPPVLSDIIIPSSPESILPVFDSVAPTNDINLPEPFSYREPSYQSDLWTELMKKILNDIVEGGTGLDIDIEDAIWSRSVERLREEREKSIRQIESKLGESGFDMPTGAMAGAIIEIEKIWSKGTEENATSIAIEQAKLAQSNTNFIIEQGVKCEPILRQFFNEQNNRILEASRQVSLTGVDIFRASIEMHNAMVNQYKADADVFETRVRAAQQEIELFKTKVESARVSGEVQSLLVDIYNKQIQATESRIKIYSLELESVKTRAEINKLSIDSYKTRVDAYNSNINAEKLKLDIYSAELEGEKGKADIYRSQVEAYSSSVSAESKKIDAEIATNKNVLDNNRLLIDSYRVDLEAYEAEINSITKKLELEVNAFSAEVSAYNAETASESSYYSAIQKDMQIKIENANHLLTKAVEEIKAVTSGYTSLKQLEIAGNEGIMNVSAQMTASALSAVHASASYGYSSSSSKSEGWNHSDSLTESHSFDETPT